MLSCKNVPLSLCKVACLSLLTISANSWAEEAPFANAPQEATVQFFGDTYLPSHALLQTATTAADPRIFSHVSALLASASFNVVNFEGVATSALMPHEFKQFLLRMPNESTEILHAANITVATLANNHSFDFGYQGLFDSLMGLRAAGVIPIGAGRNIEEASRPVLLPSSGGPVCIYAFSRVLPSSFWAGPDRPGTAYLDLMTMTRLVRECASSGYFTVVVFHWGEELRKQPQSYQSYIAHQLIDAGAHAIVGHHPHVLQPIEVYAGRPIINSLGNFAFGSKPRANKQEGMAVALHIGPNREEVKAVFTPLIVNNDKINYQPRLLKDGEPDPIAPLIPARQNCAWDKVQKNWTCLFKKPQT